MKLTKTFWLILSIGVFVIAFAALYLIYLQQQRTQEPLDAALATAQTTLPKLTTERTNLENALTELEDELVQAKSRLETAKAVFPALVESIEIDELLFGFAHDWGLEIVRLTASEPGTETVPVEVENVQVEDVAYVITSFTMEVKGQVSDILNFINTIVTHEDFTTATVKLVSIAIPEPLSEEEKQGLTKEQIEAREQVETPSATINIGGTSFFYTAVHKKRRWEFSHLSCENWIKNIRPSGIRYPS